MAAYRRPTMDPDPPVPRNDAYTGLLLISFSAMLIGCLLLFIDWFSYDSMSPPKAAAKLTPIAPGKGERKGGVEPKADPKIEPKVEPKADPKVDPKEMKKDDPKEMKKDDPKEMKKDEAKKDEMKKDEAKKDEAKKDEAKKDEAKKDEAKKDEAKKDEK